MLVIAFISIHDNFEMTTIPLFHSGNKDFEEIQQIITSTEAANLAKPAVETITDLAMMAKKKESEKYSNNPKTNKEYFNSRKKSHYAKDCYASSLNKKKPEKSLKKAERG